MKPKILLIGSGGHCKVVLDLLLRVKEYEVVGLIDVRKRLGAKVFGTSVIGRDADLPRFFRSGIKYCFISIGSVGDPGLRVKLYGLAKRIGFILPNLISPSALVSSRAILGEGNYIAPWAAINAGTQIGNACILNTGAIIEHDCKIGNFVHISSGAILSGGVSIGAYSHIGAGSVIIQNLRVAEETIIGAGSVVTKNIHKGKIAYGNPCKERKANA